MPTAIQKLRSLDELFELDLSVKRASFMIPYYMKCNVCKEDPDVVNLIRHENGGGWKLDTEEGSFYVAPEAYLDHHSLVTHRVAITGPVRFYNSRAYHHAHIQGNVYSYDSSFYGMASINTELKEDRIIISSSKIHGHSKVISGNLNNVELG